MFSRSKNSIWSKGLRAKSDSIVSENSSVSVPDFLVYLDAYVFVSFWVLQSSRRERERQRERERERKREREGERERLALVV